MKLIKFKHKMIFDPITYELKTNEGLFIKKMKCPKNVRNEDLIRDVHSKHNKCEYCNKRIINTSGLADHELLSIVEKDPKTCLLLEFDQENILVFHK